MPNHTGLILKILTPKLFIR